MSSYSWHFFIGMVVSFLGSIPLGTVNLKVIQTTINENVKAGLYFALGATLVELVYSWIALKFSGFLIENSHIDYWIQVGAIPAFLCLGIYNYQKEHKAILEVEQQVQKGKSFLNGIFIGLINPLQIPFWIAYGTLLLSNDWIINDDAYLNVFILGIVTGSYLLLAILAFTSQKISRRLKINGSNLNRLIGIVFILLACYQLGKVLFFTDN
ncbi:MAG TPA: LysE family transporter [Cytophagaceae bacterium]